MLLNRNSSCNSSSGVSWLVYVALLLIAGVIVFGARDKIKHELHEFASINKEEVKQIVKEYIDENPKAIIASIQEMQKREYEEMMKQAQAKIHDNKDALQGKDSEIAPFSGNKNGDVVIVTFLDYRCGYCKKTNNDLKQLVQQDPNVKIVFKEYPVLGLPSQNLARTALAVYLVDPSKYIDFHNALMNVNEVNDKILDQTYKSLNLDKDKIVLALKDPRVQKELENVVMLAEKLDIRGTPAFIIDEELIPGAIDLKNLTDKVKNVREKNNKK